MADFTGMTVRVTLKGPPNVLLEGRVSQVVPGEQSLWLQDVFFPHDGSRYQTYKVRGPLIQDLQVVNTNVPPNTSAVRSSAQPALPPQNTAPQQPPSVPAQPAVQLPIRTASGQPQRQPSDFVDPAILSYGRSPVQAKIASRPPEPTTPVKSMLAKAAESLPTNSSPFVAEAGKSSSTRKPSRAKDVTQQEPGAKQSISVQTQIQYADGTQEVHQVEPVTKKKARRPQKKKNGTHTPSDPPPVMNAEVSRNGNDMDGSIKRGKGWRQTPLLQPSPQATTPQSKGSAKGSRKEQNEAKEAQQNGWATEDATDIQDLGDFDFEANHKLFDKKQVFDELRQGDVTAEEDRLVSHNKAHRPGTYGGKNLHPTESVVSPQLGPKYNSNEAASSSDADTELNFANGRSSSRHSNTRRSLRKQPSRQNSAQVEAKPFPLNTSMSRSVTSLSGRPGRSVPSNTASPRLDRTQSQHSAVSTAKSHVTPQLVSHASEPQLIIYPTLSVCPVLLPTALETLEKETVARYGLTHDAITESAARCIAETTMSVLNSTPGSRRPSRANTLRGYSGTGLGIAQSSPPVVVIIAGNHTTGARGLASARHLVSRKTKVIIAEAQYESAEMQDVQMKTQSAILKRMLKSGAGIKRGPWRKAWNYIKNLPSPPAVIIDALLAGSTYDSLLNDTSNTQHATESQKETREMIDWANRSRAAVLSIGCPSGVSGSDGSTTTIEGEPLAIRPDKVLCLAAPMQGALEAMKGGERWEVFVADIGVNITLRSDEAVAFGANWVSEVRFVDGNGQGDGKGADAT